MRKSRITAFLIDLFIISIVTVVMANNYRVNPYLDKYGEVTVEYNEEFSKVYEKYYESKDPKTILNSKELIKKLKKTEKYNLFFVVWYSVFFVSYHAIFAYFNNGQTLGKKFCKLKIVTKDDEKVSFIKMFIRSLFNGTNLSAGIVIFMIIREILAFIPNFNMYFECYLILSFISLIFELATFITFILTAGQTSLMDKLLKTKVVSV